MAHFDEFVSTAEGEFGFIVSMEIVGLLRLSARLQFCNFNLRLQSLVTFLQF